MKPPLAFLASALALSSLACSPSGGGGSASGSGAASGDEGNGGNGSGATGSGTGGGLDVGANGGSGNGNICEDYVAESQAKPPVILILLDQSGSMKEAEGATTRWDAATHSVKDASANLEARAEFGLIGFPTHLITSDADASQSCNAELKVVPGLNQGGAIATSINPAVPQMGHTPVRAALELAHEELSKPAYADKSRYVVLVTDGLPNCKGIDPTSSASSGFANYEDPSDAVTTLKDAGVTTFVIGYAIEGLSQWSEGMEHVAVTYADNMAEAGGTVAHHPVSSGPELEEVLSEIIGQVAPCSFELDDAPRGGPTFVRVTVDGVDYAFDTADGWTLEGEKTVALNETGAACALLRDGQTHSIQIQVECEPVVTK